VRAWDNVIERNLDEALPRVVEKTELKFVDDTDALKQLDSIEISGRKAKARAKGTTRTSTVQKQDAFFELSDLQKKNNELMQEFFPNGFFPKKKIGMFKSKKASLAGGSPNLGARQGNLMDNFDDIFSTKNLDNLGGNTKLKLPDSFKNIPSGNIKVGSRGFGKGFGVTKGLNSLLGEKQNFNTKHKFAPAPRNVNKNLNQAKFGFEFKVMPKLDSLKDMDSVPKFDTIPKFDNLPKMDSFPKIKGFPETRTLVDSKNRGIRKRPLPLAMPGFFRPGKGSRSFRTSQKTGFKTDDRFLKDLWSGLGKNQKPKTKKSKRNKKSKKKRA